MRFPAEHIDRYMDFDSALKSMIDLISDWKIRTAEIEGQNVLSLTYMVNDFIFNRTKPDVFFSQSALKISIK